MLVRYRAALHSEPTPHIIPLTNKCKRSYDIKMKALALIQYGTPDDAFRYQDMPDPVAQPHEVIVKVEACALNHLDLWMRQGKPRVASLPHIIGSDIAGTVVGTGERVVVQPGISCMACDECASGNHNACDHYTTLGLVEQGGYAEFVKVPRANIAPLPDNLSFAEGASLPLVLTTAHHMIVTNGKLQRGEWVLVQGASSGVGSIAIQIVKALGGHVITTCSSAVKAENALAIGADYALLPHENTVERVRAICGGVDLVVEHTGIETFAASMASLKKGGRLVSCGATTQGAYPLDLTKLFWLRQTIIGSRMGRKDDLIRGLKLVEAGLIKPVVAAEFALKDGAKAHDALASRQFFGKVVLRV
jgi:NADPH:quinone reductase-like Zn-dependent oxidoreductase